MFISFSAPTPYVAPTTYTTQKECKDTVVGLEYLGTLSVTTSGVTCQAWATNTPHTVNHQPADAEAAGSNYCRNADRVSDTPWCYTTDPNLTWEYCDVPLCPSKYMYMQF